MVFYTLQLNLASNAPPFLFPPSPFLTPFPLTTPSFPAVRFMFPSHNTLQRATHSQHITTSWYTLCKECCSMAAASATGKDTTGVTQGSTSRKTRPSIDCSTQKDEGLCAVRMQVT